MNMIEGWVNPTTGELAPMQNLTPQAAEVQGLECRTLVFHDDLDDMLAEDDAQELRNELEEVQSEVRSWEERYDELYGLAYEAHRELGRVMG